MPDTLPHDHHDPHHARRWAVLAVLSISQLMIVLDATIMNIALPSAQRALGFQTADSQWVITAYALAFGSLLLFGGRLGDLLGRKYIFVGGLIGFAIASAVGGAAQSFGLLVAARAGQGVFGALLAPAALGLLTTTFTDPSERAKAFGIFGAIAGGGAAIGLLLGGVLTEYLSWRWCLYVNLAFALPAAAAALALFHHVPHPDAPRIDWLGTVTATVGLLGIVYGFSLAEREGWTATATIACLVGGHLLMVLFALIERRVPHPLLPLRVVLDRGRGGAYLAIGISAVGMFAVFLFLTYYMQRTLGYTPVRTGVAFLPMPVAIIATATTATTLLVPRVGPRPLMTAGMILSALAMVALAQLEVDSTYAAHIAPVLVLNGIGMGLIFAPAMATGTLGVTRNDAGVASAMINTMQQIGGSLGTAALSSIAANAVSASLKDHAAQAAGGPKAQQTVAALAQMDGYTTAFWWAAGIFLLGAVVAFLVLPRGVPEGMAAGAQPAMAH